MAQIIAFFKNLFLPKTKFRAGDYVQSFQGGPLMVVQSVKFNRESQAFEVICKWFDETTKTTRTNLFKESQLRPFDWNNT